MEEKPKFNCDSCNYFTKHPSEWLKHISSKKHERNGKPKTHICDICQYETKTHWNLKMHNLSVHATKDERSSQKYYCNDCDQVFFSYVYYHKHMNGIKHKNYVLAIKSLSPLSISPIVSTHQISPMAISSTVPSLFSSKLLTNKLFNNNLFNNNLIDEKE